jgi:hypothetical protein
VLLNGYPFRRVSLTSGNKSRLYKYLPDILYLPAYTLFSAEGSLISADLGFSIVDEILYD